MLQPGDEIDIWVVDRALGQGGMGSVYRCHNREARRILAAIKVLDSALGRQERAKARFIREAEILFSLDHPNIVKVRNVRMDVALPYLEMEYIDGINLETRVREGALNVGEALPIFRQIAEAVTHLHGRGIRHRDIKPSNIVMQANGGVKLVDFGIATEADSATITHHGQTFGSVSYAPPEWLDPTELDAARWDIYALGLVFWEALTGVQAFPMNSTGSVQQQMVRLMTAKQDHPPLDPGGDVPEAIRALIRDMTIADWRARIQDIADVRARLGAIDPASVNPEARGEAPARGTAPRAPAGDTMVPVGLEAPAPFQLAHNATITEPPEEDLPAPPARTDTRVDVLPVVKAPRTPIVQTAPSEPRIDTLPVAKGPLPPRPPPEPEARPKRPVLAMLLGSAALLALVGVGAALAWQATRPVEVVAIAAPPPLAPPPAQPTPPPVTPVEPTETVVAAVDPVPSPVPKSTAEKPRPRGPSNVVTASAFSRWLGTHPEWAPDAARAAGKADAAYLSGWDGTTPPAGKGSSAVVNVPWAAASSYCAGRGGLPGVDDGALTWTESAAQPWHEYRSADGRPAWRRSDGATSTAVNRSESGAFIGFRCAK